MSTSDQSGPGSVVELFAGIGGFRLGLERRRTGFTSRGGWSYEQPDDPNWHVVWGNQWEPSTKSQPAFDCYVDHFSDDPADVHVCEDIAEVLNEIGVPKYDGDTVRDWDELNASDHALPQTFDLLVGGFPCQDYSVAKPLSQAAGLGGEKGILWWEIARVLQQYRPPHVLLENVDRLLSSPSDQRGRDFAVMLACFAQLGYAVEWRVVNAAEYGYPQRRRRVFIYATRSGSELERLGVEADRVEVDPERWLHTIESIGQAQVTEAGVLADALECQVADGAMADVISLGETAADVDPYDISESWKSYKSKPWSNAGIMVGGVAWTVDVQSTYEGEHYTLGDILLPADFIRERYPEFVIPEEQLGRPSTMDHDRDVELGITGTWRYLKGAKKVPRGNYHYSEGAVAFPEPLDRASRTVLTGEGGSAPSRFKLAVEQDGMYRRVTPRELERLDMFPDNWTEGMSDGRRAFCMGNALVVGVVERIGDAIAAARVGDLRVPLSA